MSSFLLELLSPRKFRSTGYMIPGRSKLLVEIGGILSFVTPKTNSLAILAGLHEPKTVNWFKVASGDVVVDVGAHIGRYSLLAARWASKVVSIEPEPSNFSELLDNIRLNKFTNVIALRVALSDAPGMRTFYLASGGDTGTSSIEPEWSWRLDTSRQRKTIQVKSETLDRVIASLGLNKIDWLKIDVESHELAVLHGSRITLAMTKHLILEVAEGNEATCREIVRAAGFSLVSIDEGKKEEGIRASSNWLLARA
jgi:FkbM family methyltransferase